MQWRHGWLAAMLVAWSAGAMPAEASPNPLGAERRVQVDLLSSAPQLQPGGRVTLAIRQTIEPGWHTYWINPGDSGEATAVDWTLPEGFEAAPLRWPLPHAIPTGPLTNYGYEGSVLLLADLTVPAALPEGDIRIDGKVRYLVCKDICIPEEAIVRLTFGPGHAPPGAAAIARTERQLPVTLPGEASYSARSSEKLLLAASLPGLDLSRVKDARFFPLEWGHISNPAAQPFQVDGNRISIELVRGEAKTTPAELKGVLALTEEVNGVEQRQGFEVAAKLIPGDSGAAAGGPGSGAASGTGVAPGSGAGIATGINGAGPSSFATTSLLTAALFAFLGGLILNLMPCVFPVLALKALSFAKGGQGDHIRQGAAYFAGVMASFVMFAGVLLFLRETGQALGWGFQFQSPEFVLALAALFFALGLSLSGVFSLGGGLMAVGDSLARKPGNAGFFFTGVLAAVAATPCTAPFMGAAIGYALVQPPLMLFAVFFALGAGFALPVLLLGVSPAFQRLLPKPGAWMETFKQVMAFPLYATAAWLIWVLSIQSGSDGVLAAAVALIGVGFAAWLAGRTAMANLPSRLAAPAVALAAVILAFSLTPAADGTQTASATSTENGSGPKWEHFTAARLDELVQSGQPVFVNFTAAWCITCKVNERVALSSDTITDAFSRANITYLKGDWTKQNPEITAVLQRFGRAGVPLYLFYPGKGQEPRVLPQLLTESIVLDEIEAPSRTTTATTKGA